MKEVSDCQGYSKINLASWCRMGLRDGLGCLQEEVLQAGDELQ